MVMVPLDVTTSAWYCLAGSMTMGGGPSNRWVFGLEPSAAGASGAIAPSPLVGCGWGRTCCQQVIRRRPWCRPRATVELGLGDGDRDHPVEGDRRAGLAARRGATGVDLVQHAHPRGHLAEEGVVG